MEQNKSNSRILILNIIIFILLFFGFIFLFISFMNRIDLNEYLEKGKIISSSLEEVSSYKIKLTKKSSESIKLMVKVRFNLNGTWGIVYLTEFISESDMNDFQDGDKIDLVYINGSEYLAGGKASFTKSPILKPILEKAIKRNTIYLFFGGIIFILGIFIFIVKNKFFKP